MAELYIANVRSDLFKDVKFFLADETNEEVKQLLKQGGASREFFVSNLATHVIASNTDFPEYNQAKDIGIPVIKPEWVTMSVQCGAQLPPSAFKNKLFSGIVACPSQIPAEDRDSIWAMVTFYGGRCQVAFDPNCTHLLVPKPEGDKYQCALQHSDKVKIVIPDWVVDCIKAKKLLDESNYTPLMNDVVAESDSILTPDNDGKTTGVAINASVDKTKAIPSSLLSPESSPSITKLTKDSEEKNDTETAEPLKEVSEEDEGEDGTSGEPKKRKGRQAAETAKERLRSVANLCEEDEEDIDYVIEGKEVASVDEKNSDENKQVIEITDEEKGVDKEKDNQPTAQSNKLVVVSHLLAGCVFYISDYSNCIGENLLKTWMTVIKQHGADVVPVYSPDCTHVLCIHQHGKYFRQALNEGKFVVTAYWLNDVLSTKKLFAPKISLHLPVPFREKVSRCRNMIISVTGFEGDERRALKNMIHMIGAKYTGYLSRSNTHLICRSEAGEKYKKAEEWGINCANARWLGDIMTGGCDYPVNMKRYRTFSNENGLDINMILARELLVSWKNFEEKHDTTDKKRKLEMLEKEMKEIEAKKPRIDEEPSESRIVEPAPTNEVSCVPRVVFTGLNLTSVRRLTELLRSLGGEPADSVKSCTHIVASKIMRTIKFLTGISVCRYIVSPEWIEASHAKRFYVDENDYILRDFENEKLYGMALPDSINKAQSRPLFKDMTVYVTPNVRPEQKAMAEIVGCAGGKLLDKMPEASSFKWLAEQKTDVGLPGFVCVTCDDDLHLCKDMKFHGIGVHNVEFVLSGILKQEMDFDRYKL